ncbi:Tn3 family transposase [Clostridium estertheticum]|uniref:Tn3 family transposase n=1 Tax=Clostridium estertheticum TaxID=238834 RepID=UPI001C0E39AF|nr:Tn3 family transposase [Clostridium estertheticum]MBU3174611.1 Tn3 family transposase [Clostridium estertheticum]
MMIPKGMQISLPNLLLEVSKTTNFHSHFLHAANQEPFESFHDITVLIFAIMGLGTNVGLSKIS